MWNKTWNELSIKESCIVTGIICAVCYAPVLLYCGVNAIKERLEDRKEKEED